MHYIRFVSALLHLNVGNGTMPLNLLPKRPPYVVFFVLYKFRVVCVLYMCCMRVVFFVLYEIVFL